MPRPSLLSLTGVLLVAMLGLMAVSAAYRARADRAAATAPVAAEPVAEAEAVPAEPEPEVVVADEVPAARATPPAPSPKPKPQPRFGVARVKPGRSVNLRSKPGGRVLERVSSSTEFGSPTTLAVAARRGRWLGVTSTALPNGTLGWTKGREDVARHSTRISLRIDLSRRRLELRSGRRVARHMEVGIGRPGSSTPTGRFAITDKLSGDRYGPYYGCCILALSGHQVNTPPGWPGGDRLAIHGTSNPATVGGRSSAGCLHAYAEDLRVLMRRVPLGTPVFIRR